MKNLKLMTCVGAMLLLAHSASGIVSGPLVDGGFEAPIVTTPDENGAGFDTQAIGTSFGGPSNNAWTAVQQGTLSNNIVIGSTTQYFIGTTKNYYNGNSGLQYADLTGTGDNGAKVGIQQTVATIPSQTYTLSFFTGRNSYSGATNTELDVNGAAVGSYSNSTVSGFPPYNGDGVAVNSWEGSSYTFTASSTSTTIAFYNLSPSGVNVNDLDDVSLTPVPEPATIGLLGLGGVVILSRRRRMRRCSAGR